MESFNVEFCRISLRAAREWAKKELPKGYLTGLWAYHCQSSGPNKQYDVQVNNKHIKYACWHTADNAYDAKAQAINSIVSAYIKERDAKQA